MRRTDGRSCGWAGHGESDGHRADDKHGRKDEADLVHADFSICATVLPQVDWPGLLNPSRRVVTALDGLRLVGPQTDPASCSGFRGLPPRWARSAESSLAGRGGLVPVAVATGALDPRGSGQGAADARAVGRADQGSYGVVTVA